MRLVRTYDLDPKKIEEHTVFGGDWRWEVAVEIVVSSDAKVAEREFEKVMGDPGVVVVCTDGSLLMGWGVPQFCWKMELPLILVGITLDLLATIPYSRLSLQG